MRRTATQTRKHQLRMPGIARQAQPRARIIATCCNITPGQPVIYNGKISGGPQFGSIGVVRQARQTKAVVDMGASGTWNIPYYFLSIPDVAGVDADAA